MQVSISGLDWIRVRQRLGRRVKDWRGGECGLGANAGEIGVKERGGSG